MICLIRSSAWSFDGKNEVHTKRVALSTTTRTYLAPPSDSGVIGPIKSTDISSKWFSVRTMWCLKVGLAILPSMQGLQPLDLPGWPNRSWSETWAAWSAFWSTYIAHPSSKFCLAIADYKWYSEHTGRFQRFLSENMCSEAPESTNMGFKFKSDIIAVEVSGVATNATGPAIIPLLWHLYLNFPSDDIATSSLTWFAPFPNIALSFLTLAMISSIDG